MKGKLHHKALRSFRCEIKRKGLIARIICRPSGLFVISIYCGYSHFIPFAREAGPELVGTIGNRTAVANNDQIVAGISSGVREANGAVVDAIYTLIQAVEDKDTSVNIGDDEIGRANDRYKRKRGLNVNSGAFANSY